MQLNKIKIGERYVYYPPKKNQEDNRHWPAVVNGISGSRIRVTLFMEGRDNGISRSVHPDRLMDQADAFATEITT